MTTAEFQRAEAEILRWAEKCAGLSPAERPYAEFEAYMCSLANRGLTRGGIWSLVSRVERENRARLASDSSDALSDYLSGLIGDCAAQGWVRLPGEPSDPEEFAKYLFERSWMNGWKAYMDEVRPLCAAFQEKKISMEEFGRSVHLLLAKHKL